MSLEIKRKCIDLMHEKYDNQSKPLNESIEDDNWLEGYWIDLKSVNLFIDATINSQGVKVFRASVTKGYDLSTAVKKMFPSTVKGFENACDWIDQQRLEFAQQIL